MKKFLSFAISLLLAVAAYAQKDVTKFLGIPVDGTKSEMIRQLKAKGFTSTTFDSNILEGEFNGRDVLIKVITNNNKVWRIGIMDKDNVSETNIRIRFNRLVSQFENNSNYLSDGAEPISENEDISYEMTVHDKRYQAAYLQMPAIDTLTMQENIVSKILEKYPQGELSNDTEEIREYTIELLTNYIAEAAEKKSVWFMISENKGEYYISMFYDNEYNAANGEDL